jgi:hypothetical protein
VKITVICFTALFFVAEPWFINLKTAVGEKETLFLVSVPSQVKNPTKIKKG